MSEPVGAPAPIETVAPVVAAPVVPVAAPVKAADLPDDALAQRLTRARETERKELLASLGVDDLEKAKAAIAAANKAENDQKSAETRLAETTTQLSTIKTEAEHLKAVATEWAARQMMGLSPEQQAAVKSIAGDDPAAQLKTITALAPTWAAKGAPVAPAATTPAGGTAPAPTAPTSVTTSPTDHKAVHAALQASNPFAAANYAMQHLTEVFPEQKAS